MQILPSDSKKACGILALRPLQHSFSAKLSFKFSVWSHQKFVGISKYVHFNDEPPQVPPQDFYNQEAPYTYKWKISASPIMMAMVTVMRSLYTTHRNIVLCVLVHCFASLDHSHPRSLSCHHILLIRQNGCGWVGRLFVVKIVIGCVHNKSEKVQLAR
jgi:hypothetical protein